MKTLEQERGALLADRLELLNEYLLSESNKTFEEFLSDKTITVEQFLDHLPNDFKYLEIGQSVLTDEDSVDTLTDYTEDLNILYFEQYLEHQDKVDSEVLSAAGDDDDSYEDEVSDNEWYELTRSERKAKKAAKKAAKAERKTEKKTGRGERKTARKSGQTKAERKADKQKRKDDIKAAKAAKKAEKTRLKEAFKRGEISRKQLREGKQTARKTMRKAVGSGVGRAIGRLNKFNPAFVLMRKAYNSILRLNVFNQAKRLGEIQAEGGEDWKKALKVWDRFGGSPSGFKTPISVGKVKRPVFGKKGSRKNADGDENNTYYNIADEALAVIITAGAGLISTLAVVISDNKKNKGEQLPPDEDPDNDPDFPPDPLGDEDETEDAINDVLAGEDDDEGGLSAIGGNKGLLYGALALAAIVSIFVLAKIAKGKKK